MTDVLDQEEIDALMDGLSSGEVESADSAPAAQKPRGSCDAYDFSREDYSLRKLWPALNLVSERFKQQVQAAFSALVRRGAVLSDADIKSMKFEEYLNTQKDVTSMNFLTVNPINTMFIVTVDADLIYTAVDLFFGSNDEPQARVGSHAFTSAELRIMHKVIEIICPAMKESWGQILPLEFILSHSETNPQFVKDLAAGDTVLTVSFDVEIGARKVGAVQMVLPSSSLEPIKDNLLAVDGADTSIPDAGWTAEFKRGISESPIELRVELAQTRIHLRDLLSLKAGDIIPVDLPGKIEVSAGKMPVLRGSFGVSNGQKAIKVNEWITPKKSLSTKG